METGGIHWDTNYVLRCSNTGAPSHWGRPMYQTSNTGAPSHWGGPMYQTSNTGAPSHWGGPMYQTSNAPSHWEGPMYQTCNTGAPSRWGGTHWCTKPATLVLPATGEDPCTKPELLKLLQLLNWAWYLWWGLGDTYLTDLCDIFQVVAWC